MKFLEVAKLIANQLNSNEFSGAISASDPLSVDISEEEFTKIKTQLGGMMTLESAVNNVEVAKAIKPKLKLELESDMRRELKNSIYTTIEDKVAAIGERIGADLSGKKIDDQLALILSAKAPTPAAPDNQAYSKLQQDFASFKESTELEKATSAQSFTDFKIDSTLRNKISSIPLAKAYQDPLLKESLFDRVISEVRSRAVIQLDDKTGHIKLLNPDNKEMELFDGNNKKVGIDDVINPLLQPYLQATPPKPEDRKQVEIHGDLPDGINTGSAAAGVTGARAAGVTY